MLSFVDVNIYYSNMKILEILFLCCVLVLPAWFKGPAPSQTKNDYIHQSQWFWLNSNRFGKRKREKKEDNGDKSKCAKRKRGKFLFMVSI